ncbi:hypothetical protein [Oricola sp.]|uniref:hypothetical protein n=1 Tax=Oricola sp. TaxID=1979950 RepID=UPI00320BF715|nr:DUF2019 domain-containing protein [Oricola sp.]
MTNENSPEERFAKSASDHGRYTIEGNAPLVNRAYRSLVSALRELRSKPDKGVLFLKGLLSDNDPSVVVWAATYLLPFDEEEAIFALEKIADTGIPRLAFSAKVTLQEWKARRLSVE